MKARKFLSFEESKTEARKYSILSSTEWKNHCRKHNDTDLPLCPNAVYKEDWNGWEDFLGIRIVSFLEAREIARSLNLNQKRDWAKFVRSHKGLKLPSNPNIYYKDVGWEGWYDFLGKTRDKRRYFVNDDFFKIWSHDMAYVLGLWWADGWIGGKIFSICLHEKDSYLLSNILCKMNSSYPVRTYGNYSVFNIRSQEIIKDIKSLGGTERKSLTVRLPIIKEGFFSSFVRGLWDGDGYVHINKYKKRVSSSVVSGSLDFINELSFELRKKINGLRGSISKSKNCNCYTLSFSKNDTIMLRDFLYRGDVGLKMERKYDKFVEAGNIKLFHSRYQWDYLRAKKEVKKYGIKNSSEWQKLWMENDKPPCLPYSVSKVYKGRGWISWKEFLN